MLVHLILENGETHSIIATSDEAEKYLIDLRRVHPDVEWEVEQFVLGRNPSHVDGCHWGYEAVYDLIKREFSFSVKAWVWATQCAWQKRVLDYWHGSKINGFVVMDRFIPVYQDGKHDNQESWLRQVNLFFDNRGSVETELPEAKVKFKINKGL